MFYLATKLRKKTQTKKAQPNAEPFFSYLTKSINPNPSESTKIQKTHEKEKIVWLQEKKTTKGKVTNSVTG